jgi:hypothetical protein
MSKVTSVLESGSGPSYLAESRSGISLLLNLDSVRIHTKNFYDQIFKIKILNFFFYQKLLICLLKPPYKGPSGSLNMTMLRFFRFGGKFWPVWIRIR